MTEARITIAPSHPSLAGHFPGEPIVPAALLLDHAISHVEQVFGRRVVMISAAKFLTPVRPGQSVNINVRRGDEDRAVATGSVDGTIVFSVSLALRRQDAR